jgi:hypothetical protein
MIDRVVQADVEGVDDVIPASRDGRRTGEVTTDGGERAPTAVPSLVPQGVVVPDTEDADIVPAAGGGDGSVWKQRSTMLIVGLPVFSGPPPFA